MDTAQDQTAGDPAPRRQGRKKQTLCKNGHDLYDPINVGVYVKQNGYVERKCLVCKREYDRLRYQDPRRRSRVKATVIWHRKTGGSLPPASEWLPSLGGS